MATRILRWGLISTARINRALIPPLRASARNQLVAVASREMEQGPSLRQRMEHPARVRKL